MFRETETHFAQVPSIDIQRSKMKIQTDHKTSFNVGDIIPIFWKTILPGDTVKMTYSTVVRMPSMLTPVMDNLDLDVSFYFVPYRLVYNRTKELYGENTAGPWAPTTEYAFPTISAPSGGFAVGSIADYLGYPVGINWSNTDANAPNVIPIRSYAKIVDYYWRDENLTYPLNIPMSDANQTGTNGSSYVNDVANGGMPFKASKHHDYFTSALPTAQKAAQPVTFPLLSGSLAPVKTTNDAIPRSSTAEPGIVWQSANDVALTGNSFRDMHYSGGNWLASTNASFASTVVSGADWSPANLWADLTSNIGAVTVNELRLAFQLQRFYERRAVAGSRMYETIRAFFGVTSPDARLQNPEYLGGNRTPITISEVTNTSYDSGSSGAPLGNVAGKSNTSDVNEVFEQSFTEGGIIMGLAVVRVSNRTYSQGMPKELLAKTWQDLYWPVFAHLGEQPVKTVEIYADGYMDSDNVFGYQEAWSEYRYAPSKTSGLMRPGVSGSLASWHFGDYYTSAPTLSDGWIREPLANVDRTLAATSAVTNQCFADFFFDMEWTRPMPMYSVPGLIDHF